MQSWPTCYKDPHILVLVLEGQDDLRNTVNDLFLEAACLPAAQEALLSRQQAVVTSAQCNITAAAGCTSCGTMQTLADQRRSSGLSAHLMHKWPGGGPPLAARGRVHRVPGLQATNPRASPKLAAGYCVRSWNKVLEQITLKHQY